MGMQRSMLAALVVIVTVAIPLPATAVDTLKIATLAPEGSSWMRLFREWDREVRKETKGRVRLKFQPGAVAGDERDMVRLMTKGRVHGAALTGSGVGLLHPEVRVLELPFMIRTYGELDHVRAAMSAHLEQRLQQRGYTLLAWGDAGWIYVFTSHRAATRKEIGKAKVWAWTDDPVARATLEVFGVRGIPLGVPDVLPGLTTGQIDCVYGSPLTVLTLGWHRKVKYMLDVPLVYATGAMIVSTRELKKLAAGDQEILRRTARKLQAKLIRTVRADNAAAMTHLKKAGIRIVKPTAAARTEFEARSRRIWKKLAGQLYSAEALAKVQRLVEDYRRRQR